MTVKELLDQFPLACKAIYFSGFDDGISYEREILERCVFGNEKYEQVIDEIMQRA